MTSSLAHKVDHVGVALRDAGTAFERAREVLGLPVAWWYGDHGGPVTGGLGLGNLNLELLDPATVPLPVVEPAALGLVALQPALAVDRLAARLAERDVPTTGTTATGDDAHGFDNVFLPPVVAAATFFCAYRHPAQHEGAIRRAELEAVGGGALGLRGVTAVAAAVDVDLATRLLGPPAGGRWRFDTGPDLVVDGSVPDGQALMTWSVVDVERARGVLGDAGAADDGDLVRLPFLGGLAIGLTEAPVDRPVGLADRRRAAGG